MQSEGPGQAYDEQDARPGQGESRCDQSSGHGTMSFFRIVPVQGEIQAVIDDINTSGNQRKYDKRLHLMQHHHHVDPRNGEDQSRE
ncbi:hypothetical protein GCM10025857_27750 [Alicyclobacillus contaminans]|nr:hypothetical protein GCM10025857_27750 [Alicyclobacillus contaminans]